MDHPEVFDRSPSRLDTGLRFTLDSPARRFRQEAMLLRDTLGREPGLSFLGSTHFTPFPGIETGFAFRLDRLLEPKGSYNSTFQRNRYYVHGDPPADSGQTVAVSLDSIDVTYYAIDSRSVSARLMRERSRRYGRMDFRLMTGSRPVEADTWTTFDLRLTARL